MSEHLSPAFGIVRSVDAALGVANRSYNAGVLVPEHPFVLPIHSAGQIMEPVEILRIEPLWDEASILLEFDAVIARISQQTGEEFITNGVNFHFVIPEEMLPQTEEEWQETLDSYGENAEKSATGDCEQNKGGVYTLRIGYRGLEYQVGKAEVLETMGHEFGHTLNDREIIEDTSVESELLAYAFEKYFLEFCDLTHQDKERLKEVGEEEVNAPFNVHDKALTTLKKLEKRGMNKEEIIAQLLQRNFCGAPYDPNHKTMPRKEVVDRNRAWKKVEGMLP